MCRSSNVWQTHGAVMSLDKLGTAYAQTWAGPVDLAARFNRADSHLDTRKLGGRGAHGTRRNLLIFEWLAPKESFDDRLVRLGFDRYRPGRQMWCDIKHAKLGCETG
jgi:hypothetical protein